MGRPRKVKIDPQQLKELRKQANLTQSEAAALVHTNLRQWAKYEASESSSTHTFIPVKDLELFCLKTNSTFPDLIDQPKKGHVIALAGAGGVGRTTLTTNTARALQMKGYNVLIVGDTCQHTVELKNRMEIHGKEFPTVMLLDPTYMTTFFDENPQSDRVIVSSQDNSYLGPSIEDLSRVYDYIFVETSRDSINQKRFFHSCDIIILLVSDSRDIHAGIDHPLAMLKSQENKLLTKTYLMLYNLSSCPADIWEFVPEHLREESFNLFKRKEGFRQKLFERLNVVKNDTRGVLKCNFSKAYQALLYCYYKTDAQPEVFYETYPNSLFHFEVDSFISELQEKLAQLSV